MDMSVGSQPSGCIESGSTKEGPLLYRAGTTYLGKEQWKSCYLVLWYAAHTPARSWLAQKCYRVCLRSREWSANVFI